MNLKSKTVFGRLHEASEIVLAGIVVLWIISLMIRYPVMVMAVVAFSAAVMGVRTGVLVKQSASRRVVWVLFIAYLLFLPVFLPLMATAVSAYQQVAHQQPLNPHALIEGLLRLWGYAWFFTTALTFIVLMVWEPLRRRRAGRAVGDNFA